jgi:energy-coupling factor transporter ATP-binding protein EcfA2
MIGQFLIDDARIRELSATRQGRVSIGGFTYQNSYAVARLASMLARQPLLDLADFPIALRYDWTEDLDELDSGGRTIFTQCKRIDDIGQPAKLADVLLSFAPKLLWTESGRRSELRFRIVCTDPRFDGDVPLAFSANAANLERAKVLAAFAGALATPPTDRSDRAVWQAEAEAFGGEALFDAIWEASEGVYLRGDVIVGDPSGMSLLPAERTALDLLLRFSEIHADRQSEALKSLRSLVHSNLVSFDPVSGLRKPGEPLSPRVIRRTDVDVELFALRTTREMEFRVVTPQFLAEQRAKEKQMYVARPPQWADVVHGQDQEVRFVERDLTKEFLDHVRSHILQPLARGTDERLHMLFLLGSPGAGKSTLVRRVAALLVEEGAVTAADFGLNLGVLDQDEIKTIVSDLKGLATPERPVLLVLDDPFFAESGWDKLLGRLAHARVPVGVIGASPNFLYDAFSATVRVDPFNTDVITMAKPSGFERAALSILHGREVRPSDEEEDFLVLAMQAAADEPFSAIVARIWTTLNDGKPINPRMEPETLPWAVRAYLVTCYFHHVYERCPEALLHEALELGSGEVPTNYRRRLDELTSRDGWRTFSVQEALKGRGRFEGRTIGAGHPRIAREAWMLRPTPAFDVAEWVIPASIRSKQAAAVGRLAGTLAGTTNEARARFAARLAKAWSEASDADSVPVTSFASLAGFLATGAAHKETPSMIPALRRRAERMDVGSWIAVLALRDLSSSDNSQKRFPEDLNLAAVIEAADFSIARGRASRFANALGPKSALYEAYAERLFAALDGSLDWKIDSNALAWLLARVPAEITPKRLQHVRKWLEQNSDDNSARANFLGIVTALPFTDPLREEFMKDTSLWLEQHQDDDNVRAKFLDIVGALPSTDPLRQEFMEDTSLWLEQHPDNDNVRAKFLDVVGALPSTDPLRQDFMKDTLLWLEQHTNNDNVRTKFLDVIGALPSTDPLRQEFMEGTSLWLEQHPNNDNVRTKFLNIVGALPHRDRLRQAVLTDTARWLREHPSDTTVRPMFLVIAGSTAVGFDTLVRSAALLDNQRARLSWQVVANAMVQPYLRAAQSAMAKGAKEKLRSVRDSIVRWYESVGMTPPNLGALSPKSTPTPSSASGFNTLADAIRRAFGESGDD